MTDTAKTQYLAAVEFEATKLAETTEIGTTGKRIYDLKIAAKQRMTDAEAAKAEAAAAIDQYEVKAVKCRFERRSLHTSLSGTSL